MFENNLVQSAPFFLFARTTYCCTLQQQKKGGGEMALPKNVIHVLIANYYYDILYPICSKVIFLRVFPYIYFLFVLNN